MTICISSLLDDWTLRQKNNGLKKFKQDTFLAPLAHNCTNSKNLGWTLCSSSIILSSSFSFVLSWLPSFSFYPANCASILRLPSLSLSLSSLFLSLSLYFSLKFKHRPLLTNILEQLNERGRWYEMRWAYFELNMLKGASASVRPSTRRWEHCSEVNAPSLPAAPLVPLS